jgi:hypothetical protein
MPSIQKFAVEAALRNMRAAKAPARPIATYYYDTTNSPADQWCSIGRAATIEGALRAAFRRVLDLQAERALIHDEFGVVVARLHRTPKGISLLYVPSEQGVH